MWFTRKEYVALIAIQSEKGPNGIYGNFEGIYSLLPVGNIHERCIVLVAQRAMGACGISRDEKSASNPILATLGTRKYGGQR
jgi:hypothetical protein